MPPITFASSTFCSFTLPSF
ncbi:MAG: hypothetical protein COU43_02070, partial [Candidatus Nealsonbacteria bacterium CG10_big_fil_rev_8_21_14_0_10_37_25]